VRTAAKGGSELLIFVPGKKADDQVSIIDLDRPLH